MSRINLKNIFSKKADALSLPPAVIESMHQDVWIEDDSGKLLAGIQNTETMSVTQTLSPRVLFFLKYFVPR